MQGNLVILEGEISNSPYERNLGVGKTLTDIYIICPHNKNTPEETCTIRAVAWNRISRWASLNLQRGDFVRVEGRLKVSPRELPDGTIKHRWEVVVDQITTISSTKRVHIECENGGFVGIDADGLYL